MRSKKKFYKNLWIYSKAIAGDMVSGNSMALDRERKTTSGLPVMYDGHGANRDMVNTAPI
jgi:hypothetical protein